MLVDNYVSFCNTPDFTHICATTSELLVDDNLSEVGNIAGLYNGIYDGDKNAGYVTYNFLYSLATSSNDYIIMGE